MHKSCSAVGVAVVVVVVVVVVVRYFGGVKLSAGGLMRADLAAISDAINYSQLLQVSPNVISNISLYFSKNKICHIA